MDLVPYAVPLFILAMLLELIYGWRVQRNTYRVNDAVGSLFLGSISQARKFVILGVGGAVYHYIAESLALWQMDASHWATWVLATILYDFCYYWLHRLGHERSILWAAHVAHHQSEDYNLSTALRQTSTGFLFSWIFYLPMFALGIPASVFVTLGSINLIYQFWVHTQHIPKLGLYEWVFVTPSNHRVHHAQNDCYVDRNYGGLFIIWDRIFGTFQEELDQEPPVYGIRGPLHTFSPFRALTHIYRDMALDSWRTRRWGDKLRVWVARTGWQPDDVAAKHPRKKADLADFQRFDPVVPGSVRGYALFQLVAVVSMLGAMQLGLGSAVWLAVAMLLTAGCTAMWLDGSRPALCLPVDGARLVFLLLLLWQVPALDSLVPVAGTYLLGNAVFLLFMPRRRGTASRLEAQAAADA